MTGETFRQMKLIFVMPNGPLNLRDLYYENICQEGNEKISNQPTIRGPEGQHVTFST